MTFIIWIISAVFGAGAMFLLDPQQGKRRRDELRQQITTKSTQLGHTISTEARNLRKKAH